MPTAKHLSRFEVNKKVRSVLVRHSVMLSQINYSSTGHTIFLKGELLKDNGGMYELMNLEAIIQELKNISGVKKLEFAISNWSIVPDGTAFKITKHENKSHNKKENVATGSKNKSSAFPDQNKKAG